MHRMINDTIIIENGDSCILYSPFSKLICSVHNNQLNSLFHCLKEKGFFGNIPIIKEKFTGFKTLTLFICDECNLECKYCYALPNNNKHESPSLDFYKNVIDIFIDQYPGQKDYFMLDFHGGGEQTKRFNLMQKIVEYAKNASQEAGFQKTICKLATNGIFTDEVYNFLVKNNFVLGISLDGPPYINDNHRPLKNGGTSTYFVESTIKNLVSDNYPFSIRVTITNLSVFKISDILLYINGLGAKYVVLQPVTCTGRCLSHPSLKTPDPNEFSEMLLKALDISRDLGMSIANYSFQYINSGHFKPYCGSMGASAMVVTTDAHLTACIEITNKLNPLAEEMFVGKVSNGRLFLNMEKIDLYMSRVPDNVPECKDCFARYLCASGCPIKSKYTYGTCFGVDNLRCEVSKMVIPEVIKRIYKHTIS